MGIYQENQWFSSTGNQKREIAGILAIAFGAVMVLFDPVTGAILFALGLAFFFFIATPTRAIIFIVCALPFDVQRQVGKGYLFLDLLYILAAVLFLRFRLFRPYWWVWLPYLVYGFVSTASRAVKPSWFYGFMVRLLIGIVLYIVALNSDKRAKTIFAMGLTIFPLTLYGLYQLAIGGVGGFYMWLNPKTLPQWTERAYSLFWQPNNFGGYCAIAVAMTTALVLSGHRQRLLKLIIVFGTLGTAISGSRGAILGASASACFICIARKKLWPLFIVGFACAILVAAALFSDLPVAQRLLENDPTSIQSRVMVDGLGVLEFLKHPIFGIGLTNFSQLMPSLIQWNYEPIPVHNIYLEQAAETGIVGVLLFWFPIGFLARRLWKHRKNAVALAGLAFLAEIATHGMFDYMLENAPQYLMLLFILFGLFTGLANALDAKEKQLTRAEKLADRELEPRHHFYVS